MAIRLAYIRNTLLHTKLCARTPLNRELSSEASGVLQGSLWQSISTHSNTLGSNVLIVRDSTDSASSDLAQRLFFELYKGGRNSTVFSFDGRYPTDKDLSDGIAYYRRTGSTSIVALGNDSIQNYCKGLASYIESGSSSLTQFRVNTKKDLVKKKSQAPLICVPTVPSSLPMTTSWRVFDDKSHIVMPLSSRAVEFCLLDKEIMLACGSSNTAISIFSSLLLQLFDIALNSLLRSDNFFSENILSESTIKLFREQSQSLIVNNTSVTYSTALPSLISIAQQVAAIREEVRAQHKIDIEDWVCIGEVFVFIKDMTNISKRVPHHIIAAEVFSSIIEHIEKEGIGCMSKNAIDKSFALTVSSVIKALGLVSKRELQPLINLATNERKSYDNKARGSAKIISQPMTASGLLEDFIMDEENRPNSPTESVISGNKTVTLKLQVLQSDLVGSMIDSSRLFKNDSL